MMFQKPRSKIGQFPCLWIGLCSAIWRHIKITFFVLTCHMSQTFLRCCESSITKSLKPWDTRVTDLTKATRSKAARFACWRKYPQSLVQWCIGCPDHSAPKALVSPQNRRFNILSLAGRLCKIPRLLRMFSRWSTSLPGVLWSTVLTLMKRDWAKCQNCLPRSAQMLFDMAPQSTIVIHCPQRIPGLCNPSITESQHLINWLQAKYR